MIKKIFALLVMVVLSSLVIYLLIKVNKIEKDIIHDDLIIKDIVSQNNLSLYPKATINTTTFYDQIVLSGNAKTYETKELIINDCNISDIKVEVDELVLKTTVLYISDEKEVLSPFFGVVKSIVQENIDVKITYDNYEKMQVKVLVPQEFTYKLSYDMEVHVSFYNEEFIGEITKIANEYSSGQVLEVTVQFNHDFEYIRPNANVNVKFIYRSYTNRLYVSKEFIYPQIGNIALIYVLRDDSIVPITIQTGMQQSSIVEIVSGDVQKGEVVIRL